jgi:hypothetical protein
MLIADMRLAARKSRFPINPAMGVLRVSAV